LLSSGRRCSWPQRLPRRGLGCCGWRHRALLDGRRSGPRRLAGRGLGGRWRRGALLSSGRWCSWPQRLPWWRGLGGGGRRRVLLGGRCPRPRGLARRGLCSCGRCHMRRRTGRGLRLRGWHVRRLTGRGLRRGGRRRTRVRLLLRSGLRGGGCRSAGRCVGGWRGLLARRSGLRRALSWALAGGPPVVCLGRSALRKAHSVVDGLRKSRLRARGDKKHCSTKQKRITRHLIPRPVGDRTAVR
jgi:hypothetical protein